MAVSRATMILLVVLCLSILHASYCTDLKESDEKVISNMKKVKDKIFKNYDKDVRPASHHNHTTHLYFDIVPAYVIELDEERSLFSLDSWFVFSWVDKRLQWNASEFEGLTRLSVPDHTVWQPDIRVYNGHSSNVDPMKDIHVSLFSEGAIWWFPPATITSFCDVTTPTGSYPYDTHECNITVGSWTHDGWQIDIDVHSGAMYWDMFSNTNPRWEVIKEKSEIVKVVRKYDCCEEPYISVDARYFLKRRPPAQIQVVLAPSILVMILTLTMFWIPSDSGKKIILGASLLIILTALTIYCAAMTKSPRTPHLAVSFVQATMIAVTIAVLLEVAIINLAGISGPGKPPEVLVRLLSGNLGTYLCVCAPWSHSVPGDKIRLHEDAEPINVDPTPKQEWLLVATGFDRLLFLVYIVVFAAIHQV